MKIGFLYEPAYWLLLEKLIHDLEREVRLVGGESFRLSSADLERACVDLIYVLPCDRIETLKQVEKRLLIINSTQSQEIAIDKIATSRLLIDNGLPTPQTIISQTPEPILKALDDFGILLLKSVNLCGGAGHRVLRRRGGQILTTSRNRTYQVVFGARNQIRDGTIMLGPPYYAQQFIGGATAQANDRVWRMYVVGKRVVMGTVRVKEGVDTPEKSIVNVATGARYEFLENLDAEMENLALRMADLIGFEVGVVDFLRNRSGQPLIIEADCDGRYLFICRKFQEAAGYGNRYNLNAYIARHLADCIKRESDAKMVHGHSP